MSVRSSLCICIAIVCAATSCGGDFKPSSAGTICDVVVATNSDKARRMLTGILETPTDGLPQEEPMFSVMSVKGDVITGAIRNARSIVVAKVSSEEYSETRIRYERNMYATPQLVVFITARSERQLSADSARISRQLLSLLDSHETKAEAARLARHDDKAAEAIVRDATSCTMLIPEGMDYHKTGKDFAWVSNNSNRAMQSICVYTYDGTTLDRDVAISKRDSVTRANIPGETEGMYMQTEQSVAPVAKTIRHNGGNAMEMRGLWVMRNDAMGGPFVSLSVVDSARRKVVVAEGFVYAPETKKRNLMKQLEAALSTLRPTTDNKQQNKTYGK